MALVQLPSGKCINTDVPLLVLGNVISSVVDTGFNKSTSIFIGITTIDGTHSSLNYSSIEEATNDYNALIKLYAVQRIGS